VQRREGVESEEEVETEPHRRAAVPGTAGIGLGGSSRWPGRIAKRETRLCMHGGGGGG
jgi:hypothetical protein